MSKREASPKSIIIETINEKGPIKWTELLVCGDIISLQQQGIEVNELIDEIINNHEVESIGYILPDMNYRMKYMLFPKGTKFEINRGER